MSAYLWRLYRGFKGKSFGNFPNLEDNRQYTHKEQKGRDGETEGGGDGGGGRRIS
jgi:hypothetical protein